MAREPNLPRIVNLEDPDWAGSDADGGRWKRVGRQAGGARIGCTLEEIQPGGQPSAFHYHLANEEAMYVVEGRGVLTTPGGSHPVKTGDYVAFAADESGAHAVENTSDAILRVLFFSTMCEPDVVIYPEERTFHVTGDGAPVHRREDGRIDPTFHYDDTATDSD